MGMNFGISTVKKPAAAGPVPSVEALFDAYMGFESVSRATNIFIERGNKLEDALENLCIIGRTLKTHASAEGLAVVKSIVRDELGMEVSMGAVKETAKKVWEQIKAFFKKIGSWISEYFTRFLGLILHAGKRIDAKISEVKGLDANADIPEWSYTGVDVTETRNAGYAVGMLKAAFEDKEGNDIGATAKTEKSGLKVGAHKVSGKADTLAALQGAKALIAHAEEFKKIMSQEYQNAVARVNKAGENDIKTAQTVQKRMKAALSVCNRQCGIFSRTVASIAIRAKTKPGKAAATKYI